MGVSSPNNLKMIANIYSTTKEDRRNVQITEHEIHLHNISLVKW